jgi:hypothetical protein
MTDVTTRLMEANLLGVFDERDPVRRAQSISTTYSTEVQWIDDEGVAVGHERLHAKAANCRTSCRDCTSRRQARCAALVAWASLPGKYTPRTTPLWLPASMSPRSPMTES